MNKDKEFIILGFPPKLFEGGKLFIKSLKIKNIVSMYHETQNMARYIIIFETQDERESFEKLYSSFFGEDYAFMYHEEAEFAAMLELLKSEGNVILN